MGIAILLAFVCLSGNNADSAKCFFHLTFILPVERFGSSALARLFFMYFLLWYRGLGDTCCIRMHRSVDENRRRSKSRSFRLWACFFGLRPQARVTLPRSRRFRGRIRCLPTRGFGEKLSLCSRWRRLGNTVVGALTWILL